MKITTVNALRRKQGDMQSGDIFVSVFVTVMNGRWFNKLEYMDDIFLIA